MRRTIGLISGACFAAALYTHPASAQKSDEHSGVISFVVACGLHQGPNGANELAGLADRCAAMKPRPSFIVAPGDITGSGAVAEFEMLRAGAKHAADLGVAFHPLPGSRDVSRFANGKERFARYFGKMYESFDSNQAHFVLLDSTISLHDTGHIDKPQLDWLDRDLKHTRAESPIIIFLFHSVCQQPPDTRPLDNDYELMNRLKGHNVVGIFTGDELRDSSQRINGINLYTSRGVGDGGAYLVTQSQLIVGVDRIDLKSGTRPERIAGMPASNREKGSQMRVVWDDPEIPFLERRRPAATLSPRAVADNPDKERAVYRVDGGPWRPLVKDRRDIWTDTFPTRDIPIGMHTADIQLTTSNDQLDQDELIFEVERDNRESTRKWAVDLPDSIQSSPVLVGDSLYVACNDGKLYSINIENGKRRWFVATKSAIVASPVVSNGLLFIGSTDRTFCAIEISTGRTKWRVDVPGPVLGAAACAHGIVCFGVEGRILGLDMETGIQRWSQPRSGQFESNAVTDGDAFYLCGGENSCYALEAAAGAERWHKEIGSISVMGTASPCLLNGRIYCVSADGALRCMKTETGQEIWSRQAPDGEDPITKCTPAVVGSSIVVCGTGGLGSVYAFDGAEGSPLWHVDIGQAIDSTAVRASPNGRSLALMARRGRVDVLDAGKGKRLWGYELGPGNIFSTPEYDGAVVYTTTMANDIQAINGPGVGK